MRTQTGRYLDLWYKRLRDAYVARQKAATTGGLVVSTRARLGFTAAPGTTDDTERLTVCPESSAWATKTRLEQARLIAAAQHLGRPHGGARPEDPHAQHGADARAWERGLEHGR